MTRIRLLVCSLMTLVLVACGTTQVKVEQKKFTGPKEDHPVIAIGNFTDLRKQAPKWLGVIQGGFGKPVKTLETAKPVKDVVRDAFADELKQRGLAAPAGKEIYRLDGDVVQYDCVQDARREAHVSLTLNLVLAKTGRLIYSKAIAVDNVESSRAVLKTGIFASVDDLKALAERTLSQAVKDFFADPEFKSAYQ